MHILGSTVVASGVVVVDVVVLAPVVVDLQGAKLVGHVDSSPYPMQMLNLFLHGPLPILQPSQSESLEDESGVVVVTDVSAGQAIWQTLLPHFM